MRLNALKSYDESKGEQTSSESNSLVTTILAKMKGKNISAGNKIFDGGKVWGEGWRSRRY